ncbi:MAG: hypothetical protein ACI9T9_001507 [Oleiphilaceae bacterium]|jgi:hypothetical protein
MAQLLASLCKKGDSSFGPFELLVSAHLAPNKNFIILTGNTVKIIPIVKINPLIIV